jgi:hypothetical protein
MTKKSHIERTLGGPIDVAAEEGGISVGAQGHTGVKGAIRHRAEAEARTKLKQSLDAFNLSNRWKDRV